MKANDRVVWMEYTYTGDIGPTGFGTILEVKSDEAVIILRDDGDIQTFDRSMLTVFEEWME